MDGQASYKSRKYLVKLLEVLQSVEDQRFLCSLSDVTFVFSKLFTKQSQVASFKHDLFDAKTERTVSGLAKIHSLLAVILFLTLSLLMESTESSLLILWKVRRLAHLVAEGKDPVHLPLIFTWTKSVWHKHDILQVAHHSFYQGGQSFPLQRLQKGLVKVFCGVTMTRVKAVMTKCLKMEGHGLLLKFL